MKAQSKTTELRELIKDARWGIWLFGGLNLLVLIFFLLDGIYNKFVFLLLFIQVFLLVVWFLPVFCYQVFYKKLRGKIAIYKALASYKEAVSNFSW